MRVILSAALPPVPIVAEGRTISLRFEAREREVLRSVAGDGLWFSFTAQNDGRDLRSVIKRGGMIGFGDKKRSRSLTGFYGTGLARKRSAHRLRSDQAGFGIATMMDGAADW
jgi:hypothetical protein